jgi:hypothetical protein
MAHIEHQRASLARAGTSMPTPYCSSRGKYTAHRAGRAREMPFDLLPTRWRACIRPLSTLLAAEFPMGRAAVITPMVRIDSGGVQTARRERAYIYLRGGDSQMRVKAPYRGT